MAPESSSLSNPLLLIPLTILPFVCIAGTYYAMAAIAPLSAPVVATGPGPVMPYKLSDLIVGIPDLSDEFRHEMSDSENAAFVKTILLWNQLQHSTQQALQMVKREMANHDSLNGLRIAALEAKIKILTELDDKEKAKIAELEKAWAEHQKEDQKHLKNDEDKDAAERAKDEAHAKKDADDWAKHNASDELLKKSYEDKIAALEAANKAAEKKYLEQIANLQELYDTTLDELNSTKKDLAKEKGRHDTEAYPPVSCTFIDPTRQPKFMAQAIEAAQKQSAGHWTIGAWVGDIRDVTGPQYGTPWPHLTKSWNLVKVGVWSRASVLDVVFFEYTAAGGQRYSYGNIAPGGVSKESYMSLKLGDRITRVKLHAGIDPVARRNFRQVVGLEFFTEQGDHWLSPTLDNSKTVVNYVQEEFAPPGFGLRGMYGQFGDNIDRLGCIWG